MVHAVSSLEQVRASGASGVDRSGVDRVSERPREGARWSTGGGDARIAGREAARGRGDSVWSGGHHKQLDRASQRHTSSSGWGPQHQGRVEGAYERTGGQVEGADRRTGRDQVEGARRRTGREGRVDDEMSDLRWDGRDDDEERERRCYACGSLAHIKRFCPQRRADQRRGVQRRPYQGEGRRVQDMRVMMATIGESLASLQETVADVRRAQAQAQAQAPASSQRPLN